jgi:hypothetical protein
MANAAGLDAYSDIARLRIDQRLADQFESAGTGGLKGSIGYCGAGHFLSR